MKEVALAASDGTREGLEEAGKEMLIIRPRIEACAAIMSSTMYSSQPKRSILSATSLNTSIINDAQEDVSEEGIESAELVLFRASLGRALLAIDQADVEIGQQLRKDSFLTLPDLVSIISLLDTACQELDVVLAFDLND